MGVGDVLNWCLLEGKMLENVGFVFCQIAILNISISELRIIRMHKVAREIWLKVTGTFSLMFQFI